jgi:hypothetical protein
MSAVGDATDPLAYAPVAIAGVALTFAIDREPNPNTENPQYRDRAGLPFTEMKLTPRLVAKLLTASYLDALPNRADKNHLGRDSDGDGDIDWNPRTIVWDPEFREINDPEWSEQVIIGASIADALLPAGRLDTAVRLWEYVLADPDARAWLDGADDGHGMRVNPWYSTNPDVHPQGVGLALPAEDFPKADPVTKPDETTTGGTGEINLVTWRPYTPSLAEGAHHVLRGDGLILGNWEPLPLPAKFGKSQRNLFGTQRVIGLTSTPAASLYHTVTASLRNPAGQFVAPTQDSLAAAAAAMTPNAAQPKVLQYDLRGDAVRAATTSYPLAMPVYAALNPKQADEDLRGVYANLIRYAVEDGQTPGTDVGELPPGYAPLPNSWVDQALAMADAIERGSLPQQGGGSTGGSGGTPSTSRPVAPPASSAVLGAGTNAPATGEPVATGASAGDLAGAETPEDPDTGPIAAAVPIGIGAGIVAGLAVPLVSRIRRRV